MRSKLVKLTRDYDDLKDLECDGMTRVLHTVLTAKRIPHTVFIGSIEIPNGKNFTPHFWIEAGGYIIDYRARMWMGRSSPHGVFRPMSTKMVYNGKPVRLPTLNDMVFKMLTGGISLDEGKLRDMVRAELIKLFEKEGNYDQGGKKNNNYKNGLGTYDKDRKKTCAKCGGKTKKMVAHHKDGNRENGAPSNIETLCWSCHEKGKAKERKRK